MEESLKKIMFVGSVGVGKTTLTQRLKGLDINYYKTQAIQFYDAIIDTPGEFLQHRKYYNALNVTATDADVIGLLVSATATMNTFPEGFSALFNKDVIGIITKTDQVSDALSLSKAREELKAAGVSRIFELSALENKGIEALEQYLRD